MKRPYGLYFKTCPGDGPESTMFKIGVMALDRSRTRLATYQNAVGPKYEEKFIEVYCGEDFDIKEGERIIKREFKDRITSKEAGLSEWIVDTSLTELKQFVDTLKSEYFLNIVDAPREFVPLTMPLCEDLAEWYNSQEK